MKEEEHCIVVGMGQAAAQFIASARKLGYAGKITCFGDEGHLPYHRPPLSKEALQNKITEPKLIRAASFYKDFDVKVNPNTKIVSLNIEEQFVNSADGEKYSYDNLIIATGGSVNKLNIANANLDNIYYLQTANDAKKLHAKIKAGTNAIIIGGGFIGLEVAASLKKCGADVSVLEMQENLLSRVTCPEVSNCIYQLHKANGIDIHLNTIVTSFEGEQSVSKVICKDGNTFNADVVIIGIGIHPNTTLLVNTKIELDNGIVVNKFCQTSNTNIYAIGDCANYPYELYGKRMRLESVPNAIEHGNIAAAHVCQQERDYKGVPWFWSNQYDLKWQIAGISNGYDIKGLRGNEDKLEDFVVWYFKEKKLIAADCLNNPLAFMLAKILISKRIEIDENLLSDENVSLKDLIKQYK